MLSKLVTNWCDLAPDLTRWHDVTQTWQQKLAVMTSGVVGGAAIWYLWKRYDNRNLPPGPTGWPITGCRSMLDAEKLIPALAELGKKYGDIISVQDGQNLMIVLNNYDDIKDAFTKHDNLFSSRPDYKLGAIMQLSDDIFSIPYETPGWTSNKNMLASCIRSAGFGSSRAIEDKVLEQAQVMVAHLEQFVADRTPVDIGETFQKAAIGVIFQVMMSRKYDYDDPGLVDVMKITRDWINSYMDVYHLESVPMFILKAFYMKHFKPVVEKTNAMRDIIRKEVEAHMETLDPDNPRDFIDIYLIKSAGNHEMKRMIENVMVFLPDLTDTMGVAMSLVLMYVIYYQDVQLKMYNEILAVTGGNRDVTWADKAQLPYSEAAMMEILRVEPPFPITAVHAVSRETTFNGYRIPTRAHIYAHIAAVHKHPELFPNPDEFKPERFIDQEGKVIKCEALMPFGKGARKCMGEQIAKMELFLFTTNLIQKYRMTFPDDHVPSLKVTRYLMAAPEPYKIVLNYRE